MDTYFDERYIEHHLQPNKLKSWSRQVSRLNVMGDNFAGLLSRFSVDLRTMFKWIFDHASEV